MGRPQVGENDRTRPRAGRDVPRGEAGRNTREPAQEPAQRDVLAEGNQERLVVAVEEGPVRQHEKGAVEKVSGTRRLRALLDRHPSQQQ